MNVKNLTIINLEGEKNEVLLSPHDTQKLGDFEDKMNLLTFRKRDSYVSIGTDSHWYTLDYFELNMMPLKLNISKVQIEFLVDFFFLGNEKKIDEVESRNLLMSSSKFKEKKIKKEENENKSSDKKGNSDNYPMFFKQVKVNETELLLSFQFSESSALNLKNTRIRFGLFEKKEKFYPLKIVIYYIISFSF